MSNTPEQKDIETRLALIEQSIGSFTKQYNNDMAELKASLKLVLENYVTRTEINAKFERQQDEIDGRMLGANNRIDKKVDKETFNKLEKKITHHLDNGSIKWGGVLQSIITTLLTGAIIGGFLYFNFK